MAGLDIELTPDEVRWLDLRSDSQDRPART